MLVTAGVLVIALMVVAGWYGFHRDEYYFVVTGQHPAIAAPDNPMLVPYLAAGWYALVGANLWAFRILPALAAGSYVVLGGLIGREFSSSRAHQLGAAAATGLLAIVLATGHLFGTTVFDMLATAAALWMLLRALRSTPQRWEPWIGFGVLTGVAMEIKVLAALVMLCCLAGILVLGPRRPLASAKPWIAAVIALVLAAPNLLWQAAHGWPQLVIAQDIASGGSGSSTSRAALIPVTALEIGPVICLVLVIGVVRLVRMPWRRNRYGWLAAGFLIFLALMLASGGKAYYPAAFYPALMAAGAGPVVDWVSRRPWRRILGGLLVAVSIIITVGLTLPVFPVGSALFKVGMGPNPDMGETVGWDGYIRTVATVAAAIPPEEQPHTIVLASNYGEAGALYLARAGGTTRLPPVYSGNNAFWYWGPPPESATDAIVVGDFPAAQLHAWYASCTLRARLHSPSGVGNSEDGAPVQWCTGHTMPWTRLWPQVEKLG
ncbi:glycosyltransferase family 39 protein [Arthrobacter livingstonensis]|uniref:glycosyltransferase family 39 protein n=1 Tax=Arthrobacter livingstonensis TaxID=670078 RepID=UPI001B880645|nr:glycosyltransferase family 39 protein [Arthrobacter livingstonensis]